MSKKGVSVVSGNMSPAVGEKHTYHIAGWYPDTPLSERKPEQVTWELFKKRSDGRFTSTNIKKKGTSTFTFGEAALGNTYRLEGYLYEPEGGGLIITPKQNKVSQISKVDLFYVDDTKGSTFSFMEKLRARANTVNMMGKELVFTLWEDDAKGSGHNESNKTIDTKRARVNEKGLATAEFMLTKALMQKAMQGEADAKQLEFYVTVEYYSKKKHATDNVNINNPFPQPRRSSASTPSTKPKPTAPPKAKGSPAEQKPESKKEERGIVASIAELGKELWDWWESKGTATKNKQPTVQQPEGKSAAIVKETSQTPISNCGEKYCIKKGDKSGLIREINIRLAGFGGNVPTDEFTDRTERMIKQFQRDYMRVPETGKICGNVLRAIDEFQNKFTIDFTEIKCKCKTCAGFGDGSNKGKYLKGNIEAYHRYEHPGIHRSLLSSIRSVKFYLTKDGRYSFNKINSGYRCRFHPEYLKKPTTNHMGKALDLHFNDKNGRTKKTSDMEIIRKDIFNKYLGAKWDWKDRNIFNLESTDVGATTWVHYDVREFDSVYLEDNFFVKNITDLNGKSIIALALELGFVNICSCMGGGRAKSTEKDNTKKYNKYKWSHSDFGNLIAKKESSDDYNKCNKTKGGLKVINNVKVVNLTIKEIQEKQTARDVFAVGRYQLIPNTLNAAVASLGLDVNKKLDEEMQDRIFDEYLIKVKRPKIIEYLEGDGTVENAMYSAAQEWASSGVEKDKRISDKAIKNKEGKVISRTIRYAKGGESYYAGDGLNKAHITPEQVKNSLVNSKNENK
jgi:hypothetical protein